MKTTKLKAVVGLIGIGALYAASASAQVMTGVYYDGPDQAVLEPNIVTLNEAAIDAIFGVNAPAIDVRYLPAITVNVAASIASEVNTQAEFNTLTATAIDVSPVISMWFVDLLSTCGTTENAPGIAGCAGGTVNVVEAPIAAAGIGPELMAHELGHNLTLGHTPNAQAPAGNLMDPTLNGNTTLSALQQAAMLLDGKVQTDAGGRFIQVRPIHVHAVPEPSAVAFLSLAGLLIGRRRR